MDEEENDPTSPVSIINPGGQCPLVLMCDHASAAIPAIYNNLGLASDVLMQHIAYDIGARDMALRLAEKLDAVAVLANFSRLLIDPNRGPEQPGFVPEDSDGIVIPANQGLSQAEIGTRMRTYYEPFHDAIANQILVRQSSGIAPAIVGIHSFTPIMQGAGRPWQAGLLWNRDPRLALPLIERLRRNPSLAIGDNQPYSGRIFGHSMDLHGGANGLANVVIEVRQDLVDTVETAREWGDRLADALIAVFRDPSIFSVQHF